MSKMNVCISVDTDLLKRIERFQRFHEIEGRSYVFKILLLRGLESNEPLGFSGNKGQGVESYKNKDEKIELEIVKPVRGNLVGIN